MSTPGSPQCSHCKQRFSSELRVASLKAATGASTPVSPLPGVVTSAAPLSASLPGQGQGYPAAGYPAAAEPAGGTPPAGYPAAGYPPAPTPTPPTGLVAPVPAQATAVQPTALQSTAPKAAAPQASAPQPSPTPVTGSAQATPTPTPVDVAAEPVAVAAAVAGALSGATLPVPPVHPGDDPAALRHTQAVAPVTDPGSQPAHSGGTADPDPGAGEAVAVDAGYPPAPAPTAPLLSREQIEQAQAQQIQAQMQQAHALHTQMQQAQLQHAQLQQAHLEAVQASAAVPGSDPDAAYQSVQRDVEGTMVGQQARAAQAVMPFTSPVTVPQPTEAPPQPTPGPGAAPRIQPGISPPAAGVHGAGGAYAGGSAPRPAGPMASMRMPRMLLVIAGGRLMALEPSNGRVVWWTQLAHQGEIIYDLQVHGDLLFALTSAGIVFCMEHVSGRTRWTMTMTAGRDSVLHCESDAVYVAHGDRLDCVNLHGWRLWSQQLGHRPGEPVCMQMSRD